MIETAQLVGGTLAAIVAVAFLRLHRWARRGLRIVCGFGLVWVAYFTTLWVSILGRATSLGTPPERATRTLILGLALLLAITAGLVVMIVTLGSPQVRAAFGKEAAGRNLGA